MPLENDNRPSTISGDQEQLGEQVKQLDEELAALRARFDQFFLGLDKKNPQKDLDELRKKVQKLKREFVRNTGLKFRIQTLHAKFLTYERLWIKTLNEIEQGTYSRDLFKLRRKKGKPEEKAKKAGPAKDDDKKKDTWSLDDGDLEADLPEELFGEPAAPPPPAKPIARQKTDPALPDEAGGIGGGPRPQSPPPPPSGAVAAARPATAPSPSPAAKPPAPPAAAAGPIARQPSKPPLAPAPLPRQATNPPPAPPGAVAARPAGRPPAPPAGAVPRQPTNPPPGAARPPPPPAAAAGAAGSGDGLSQDKVKKIYDAFVTAKKRCRESTDGITLEAVEQSLRKQVPQLMKEHGAKSVDFKVVIKDGKAVLKAVPK